MNASVTTSGVACSARRNKAGENRLFRGRPIGSKPIASRRLAARPAHRRRLAGWCAQVARRVERRNATARRRRDTYARAASAPRRAHAAPGDAFRLGNRARTTRPVVERENLYLRAFDAHEGHGEIERTSLSAPEDLAGQHHDDASAGETRAAAFRSHAGNSSREPRRRPVRIAPDMVPLVVLGATEFSAEIADVVGDGGVRDRSVRRERRTRAGRTKPPRDPGSLDRRGSASWPPPTSRSAGSGRLGAAGSPSRPRQPASGLRPSSTRRPTSRGPRPSARERSSAPERSSPLTRRSGGT